jgi:hypothetical protein
MAITHLQQYQHQWQSKPENTRRVRFFIGSVPNDDIIELELLRKVATEFKLTPQAQWVEDNGVKLQWGADDNYMLNLKQVVFYGDVSHIQYTDYALRFL